MMDEKMKFISELGHYSYWKDDPLILEIWSEKLKDYEISEIKKAVQYLFQKRHGFVTLAGVLEVIKKQRKERDNERTFKRTS